MSRATTLPPRWAALAAAYGGVQQLATACGVSQMTLWRWARGTRPGPLSVRAVQQMAARRKLADPWESP